MLADEVRDVLLNVAPEVWAHVEAQSETDLAGYD